MDSDYAGNRDSHRSMTGYAFMFSGGPESVESLRFKIRWLYLLQRQRVHGSI